MILLGSILLYLNAGISYNTRYKTLLFSSNRKSLVACSLYYNIHAIVAIVNLASNCCRV